MLRRFTIGALRHFIFRATRDENGVSAVEFALIAPLMVGLYLGSVEVSEAISVQRKVSLAVAAVSNLAAQTATISSSDMTNILNASASVVVPYASSKLKIVLSCISINASSQATVKWSVTYQGTARTVGSYTFASANAGIVVPGTQLLLAEATYAYTPTVGYTITGTLNLADKMFMSPRVGTPTYNGTACT